MTKHLKVMQALTHVSPEVAMIQNYGFRFRFEKKLA